MGKTYDLREERLGAERVNKYGSRMRVVEYTNYADLWVQFEHGDRKHTRWVHFDKGATISAYDKTTYGVGYLGEGSHQAVDPGTQKHTVAYQMWAAMIQRCYSPNKLNKYPSYRECVVHSDWHCFQNFAEWHSHNFYRVGTEKMGLDKDILGKNSKVYSAESCLIVPQTINSLFAGINRKKDSNLPIGVSKPAGRSFFKVQCNKGRGQAYSSSFSTVEEAFQAYKQHKEAFIKEVAEQYKHKIPGKVYQALCQYTINIDD